ncbi:TRAP transporter large permease [Brevibacterium aurantiacum]|uniref:C4-dicarboxylate ABC transporter permease n=1 Tax=Brevibacterium aurantiacum TaxID=273384 RepID=A0A2A3ZJL1_BREAU|nr:TRAP transporter large permease [Brevibacterium aurantiacum]PCC52172.1 C4-dicarboxylate ABC transporter permease [Brevibacterium aurantiacum]
MSAEAILAVCLVIFTFLGFLATRLHVGLSLMLSGILGIIVLRSLDAAVGTASNQPYSAAANYSLTIIPLFILMGVLAVRAGLAQAGFDFSSRALRKLPGGSALASIAGSGLFAAVTGSSVATVATMAKVSTDAITKAGHGFKLAAGVVCAGGTLGVLIPPSIVLVLYGIVASESIGQLLLAGIGPGLLTILAYGVTAMLIVTIENRRAKSNPDVTSAPKVQTTDSNQKKPKLDFVGVAFLTVIFIASIGTIYMGIATPTEAASFGAIAALLVTLIRVRPPKWLSALKDSMTEAIGLTAMTFLLMAGAGVFTYFLALSGTSSALVNSVVSADFPPYVVLVLCLALLLPLGMFLDGISMILIAAPLLHPILTEYGFDGIWLGVLIVKVAEMALITPPVGMNAFVYSGAVRGAGLGTVFRGIVPFIVADVAVVAVLIMAPDIVTFLPELSAAQ